MFKLYAHYFINICNSHANNKNDNNYDDKSGIFAIAVMAKR